MRRGTRRKWFSPFERKEQIDQLVELIGENAEIVKKGEILKGSHIHCYLEGEYPTCGICGTKLDK